MDINYTSVEGRFCTPIYLIWISKTLKETCHRLFHLYKYNGSTCQRHTFGCRHTPNLNLQSSDGGSIQQRPAVPELPVAQWQTTFGDFRLGLPQLSSGVWASQVRTGTTGRQMWLMTRSPPTLERFLDFLTGISQRHPHSTSTPPVIFSREKDFFYQLPVGFVLGRPVSTSSPAKVQLPRYSRISSCFG